MSNAPIRFILLAFERIVKTPSEVAVMRTISPRSPEKSMLTIRRMSKMDIERYV